MQEMVQTAVGTIFLLYNVKITKSLKSVKA